MKSNQNLAQNLRCVKSLVDDGILELGLFYKPSSCALRIYLDTPWIEGSDGDPIARFSYSYGYASAVCQRRFKTDTLLQRTPI